MHMYAVYSVFHVDSGHPYSYKMDARSEGRREKEGGRKRGRHGKRERSREIDRERPEFKLEELVPEFTLMARVVTQIELIF
jgi:hypothetical protein